MEKTNKKIDLEKADKEVITYLELLLEKKKMTGLPEDILADMLMDLYIRFENFLFLSVMQKMDPQKYQKFDDFMETNPTPTESQNFLQNNVDDLGAVIRGAMAEFEDIYLGIKK